MIFPLPPSSNHLASFNGVISASHSILLVYTFHQTNIPFILLVILEVFSLARLL